MSALLAAPFWLAAVLLLHASLAAAVKAVLGAFQPLAEGEPPVAEAQRSTLWTASRRAHPVWVALGAATLAAAAAGASGWVLCWLLAAAAQVAALWRDLACWDRVVVSAGAVWHQHGWRQAVQRVPMAHIRDVQVQEGAGQGWSLRLFWPGQVALLVLETDGGPQPPLLVTDSARGVETLESLANQVRARMAQQAAAAGQGRAWADANAQADAARAAAAAPRSSADRAAAEERLALRRLRDQALAPDLPPAATGHTQAKPPKAPAEPGQE